MHRQMIVADCTWFRNPEKDEVTSKLIDYLSCYKEEGHFNKQRRV